MDLIEFLTARLAEDEAVAQSASPSPWHPNAEHDEVWAVDDVEVCTGFALSNNQLRATVDHIARHDPARVLREVAAIRDVLGCIKLLDEKLAAEDRYPLTSYTYGVLESLVDIWSDHPDYESWASD